MTVTVFSKLKILDNKEGVNKLKKGSRYFGLLLVQNTKTLTSRFTASKMNCHINSQYFLTLSDG